MLPLSCCVLHSFGKGLSKYIITAWHVTCKGKGKVKFTLEQTTKAQKGIKAVTLLYVNLDARCGGCSTPLPGHFTPLKTPAPIE
jgi:ABC-type nickel/cobalt efflux system permease component RcnA